MIRLSAVSVPGMGREGKTKPLADRCAYGKDVKKGV